MEDRKSSLFFDLCRLCLDKPGFNSIGKDLCRDIEWCTSVQVSASENLPKKICFSCLDVIHNAKKLKELAIKNDLHLKSLFGDSDEEQLSETETNGNVENISSNYDVGITVKSTYFDSESTTQDPTPNAKLNVRKDLFESPSVSPTVKERRFSEDTEDTKFKKIKVGQEYQFECKVCNKSFDKWKKYYLHQRFHNKNISCPLDGCDKKFAAKGDLEKHLRTHTGEKPYQCSMCCKKFSQRGTLKSHIDAVHDSQETVTGV